MSVLTERDRIRDLMRTTLGRDIYREMQRDPRTALDAIVDQFIRVMDTLGYEVFKTNPTDRIKNPDIKTAIPDGYVPSYELIQWDINPDSMLDWIYRYKHSKLVIKVKNPVGHSSKYGGYSNKHGKVNAYPEDLVKEYKKHQDCVKKRGKRVEQP